MKNTPSFRNTLARMALAFSVAASATTVQSAITEEMIVSVDFESVSALDTANSVSVVTGQEIERQNAESLSELLSLTPNVNFSSGASRGKYFQIRGVGARSQFVDPINPGVGLLVDGIDLSTLGGSATLIDVDSIEVLRGPQGTEYGANALGGLINIRTNQPSDSFQGRLTSSLGDSSHNDGSLDSWRLGAVVSGPVSDNMAGRLAVEQVQGDGFINNRYLNRDDTNQIDELTVRGKLSWQVSDRLNLGFTGLVLDIDNGYDAFTLDNSLTTESDEPGRDTQDTLALGIESSYRISDQLELFTLFSHSQTDSIYSFDLDWTNPDVCVGFSDCYDYSGFDQYQRETEVTSADVRLAGTGEMADWVIGLYLRDQQFELDRTETFSGTFQSRYETRNIAGYGQLSMPISESTRVVAGLRLERFDADYTDSVNERFEPGESLWGGHLSLEQDLDDQSMIYVRIARGYKSGGANSEGSSVLPSEFKVYATEHLINYEIGFKGLSEDGTLMAQLAAFYQDREDAQIKQSFVTFPCPCTAFTDYTDNAPSAFSAGVEAEIQWQATDRVELFLSVGLLTAEFNNYLSYSHIEADLENDQPFNLDGRQIAQAPSYQYLVGAQIQLVDSLDLWVSYEGKDDYLFSNRHNASSGSINVLNSRLTYRMDAIELALWGKNLTDETVRTRGFGSFGNDPRDGYTTNNYYQFGAPREVGVSGTYRF